MTLNVLIAVPVVLPLFGAGLCLALASFRRMQHIVSLAVLGIVLGVAVILMIASQHSPLVIDVGGWAAPVGISLVADRLSTIMLVTSVTVTLAVLAYSIAQGVADGESMAPTAIYHPAFLILSAGVSNAFLSGDLFNIYVGFEILLAASFVLITLGGRRDRIRSGTVYVVVSLISSVIFVVAIALIYASTGTVNLAQLALRLQDIDPGFRLVLQVMLLVAFGIKAAIFPLSAWLPDSYPTAPAPVTAVFAGLLTKVGVYAIIRTQVLLFPNGRLDNWLAAFAIATMVIGIMGAVAQQDIKRLLSFTLISHIGFMIWGISTSTTHGLAATIFYAVHHITVQTVLFLGVGLIERTGGTTSLIKLGGLAKAAPLLAAFYLIPGLALAGVPPLSGFFGKIGLIQASAERGTPMDWALIGAGLLTSFLTLYAIVRAWNMAFWQQPPQPLQLVPIPTGMKYATGALVAVVLGLTVAAAPLARFTHGAAEELDLRVPYIYSVLPEGGRGQGISPDVSGDPVPEPSVSAPAPKVSEAPHVSVGGDDNE